MRTFHTIVFILLLVSIVSAADRSEENLSNRDLLMSLKNIQALIDQGTHSEAIPELQKNFLDHPNRTAFVTKDKKTQKIITHYEADKILSSLPRAGLDMYRLNFNPRAAKLLDSALRSGDIKALADVSSRYFYTKAGVEATVLLAIYHLDRGDSSAAYLLFDRILERGSDVDPNFKVLALFRSAEIASQEGNKADRDRLLIDLSHYKDTQFPISLGGKSYDFDELKTYIEGQYEKNRFHQSNDFDWWVLKKRKELENTSIELSQPLDKALSCHNDNAIIKSISFSPSDPNKVFTANTNGEVYEWNLMHNTKKLIHRVKNTSWRTERHFSFSQGGKFLSWNTEKGIEIFNVEDGLSMGEIPLKLGPREDVNLGLQYRLSREANLLKYNDGVSHFPNLDISRDGKYLAAIDGHKLSLWDIPKKQKLAEQTYSGLGFPMGTRFRKAEDNSLMVIFGQASHYTNALKAFSKSKLEYPNDNFRISHPASYSSVRHVTDITEDERYVLGQFSGRDMMIYDSNSGEELVILKNTPPNKTFLSPKGDRILVNGIVKGGKLDETATQKSPYPVFTVLNREGEILSYVDSPIKAPEQFTFSPHGNTVAGINTESNSFCVWYTGSDHYKNTPYDPPPSVHRNLPPLPDTPAPRYLEVHTR